MPRKKKSRRDSVDVSSGQAASANRHIVGSGKADQGRPRAATPGHTSQRGTQSERKRTARATAAAKRGGRVKAAKAKHSKRK